MSLSGQYKLSVGTKISWVCVQDVVHTGRGEVLNLYESTNVFTFAANGILVQWYPFILFKIHVYFWGETPINSCFCMLPLQRKETLGYCMSKDCKTTTDLSWVIVMGNISNFINMFHMIQVARWPGFLNCITMLLAWEWYENHRFVKSVWWKINHDVALACQQAWVMIQFSIISQGNYNVVDTIERTKLQCLQCPISSIMLVTTNL